MAYFEIVRTIERDVHRYIGIIYHIISIEMEVLVFLYPIIMGGLVVLAGALFTLYKCLPKCWRKCKEAECDCCSNIDCKPDCSNIYCKPDCSDVDCGRCRNLFGGVLDDCCRLKVKAFLNEPRSERTGLRGFRHGPTQTRLCSHRKWLEARNFGLRK